MTVSAIAHAMKFYTGGGEQPSPVLRNQHFLSDELRVSSLWTWMRSFFISLQLQRRQLGENLCKKEN